MPGISTGALNILKGRVAQLAKAGIKLICSLTFDEVAIRKHVQWCNENKEFLGYVTYTKIDKDKQNDGASHTKDKGVSDKKNDGLPIVNQALVFMVNGVKDFLQLPVAYYFIQSVAAIDKIHFLTLVLKKITE